MKVQPWSHVSGAVKWGLPMLPNPFPLDLEPIWHKQRLESCTAGRLKGCCLLIPQSLI